MKNNHIPQSFIPFNENIYYNRFFESFISINHRKKRQILSIFSHNLLIVERVANNPVKNSFTNARWLLPALWKGLWSWKVRLKTWFIDRTSQTNVGDAASGPRRGLAHHRRRCKPAGFATPRSHPNDGSEVGLDSVRAQGGAEKGVQKIHRRIVRRKRNYDTHHAEVSSFCLCCEELNQIVLVHFSLTPFLIKDF